MHRAKSHGTLIWTLAAVFLLAAVIAGIFLYWKLQARTHDTSGMILVNMAEFLLRRQ